MNQTLNTVAIADLEESQRAFLEENDFLGEGGEDAAMLLVAATRWHDCLGRGCGSAE